MITDEQIRNKIDQKTKPLGALGQLEHLAFQLCKTQNTLTPELKHPKIFVFAADHGLSDEGVSAYPKEVTAQMVLNFVNGGAAINVFAQQHQIELAIVDAGVDFDFDATLPIHHLKVSRGTGNCLRQKAMNHQELELCKQHAFDLVDAYANDGGNLIGFGEMGIGNTSSASLIHHYILGTPLEACTGKGTGLEQQALNAKVSTLKQVAEFHGPLDAPEDILAAVGGFEIAMIAYAMQRANAHGISVMVDGYIASAAALIAAKIEPKVRHAMIFCHQSEEPGHLSLLAAMEAQPILKLNMRLGEGSACALAYPLIQSACEFVNNMASFESAEVSSKNN